MTRQARRARGRPRLVTTARDRRNRGERAAGFTLVETLVAVSVLGIAVVGILMCLATFLRVGGVARSIANLDQVVRTYSERVNGVSYVPCASGYPSITLPSGYAFSSGPTITYWNGDNPATFSATCSTDKGVQHISATVREQGSGQTSQFVVTKNSG